MTLRLNNQALSGKEFNVNIKLPFGDSDMSGKSSGTDSAEQGIKAKELTVSYVIPFDHSDYLTQITSLAEALDTTTGRRVIYRIGHDAAEAMHFYQAKFSGELNIQEMTDIQGWTITFTMKEKLSVPERKGQRDNLPAAQQQTREGDAGTDDGEDNDDLPPNTGLTGTERFFKRINDWLGSDEEEEEEKKKEEKEKESSNNEV